MVVDEDNLTLDGAGYTVEGSGGGNGIHLPLGRTGVTVKNLNIKKFYYGIYLNRLAQWNTLTNNTASENAHGIYFRDHCDNNTLTNNTASHNTDCGIFLYPWSRGNTLKGNTASYNNYGIYLWDYCYANTLTNNTASYNYYGILIESNSYLNTLTGNTVSNNYSQGIYLNSSSNNKIYNNNFIDNSIQACVHGGSSNPFNLAAPVGGNYWSDWTTPDDDGDGFVDSPYVFYGGQDNLPWTGPITPVGDDVTVDLGSDVTITFENVTAPGTTTMTTSDIPPESSFSVSFIPIFYNIHTTATFTGNVRIEIAYDGSDIPSEDEPSLRLLKFAGTPPAPLDITDDSVSPNPDTEANKIIGMTDGFSVFGVGTLLNLPPIADAGPDQTV